jgi:cytochrome oxidase Cu insertion factor (SCO1/SenC/PrrC family)
MPHLQELVKLHKDAPFALIGINTGDAEGKYREGLKQFGVTWISAYQGAKTPIADLYQVKGYPTYFLIDPDGKLVRSSHSSKDYDEPIAKLLKELEEKQAE